MQIVSGGVGDFPNLLGHRNIKVQHDPQKGFISLDGNLFGGSKLFKAKRAIKLPSGTYKDVIVAKGEMKDDFDDDLDIRSGFPWTVTKWGTWFARDLGIVQYRSCHWRCDMDCFVSETDFSLIKRF